MRKWIFKLEEWYKNKRKKFLVGNGDDQNVLYDDFISTMNIKKWTFEKVFILPFTQLFKKVDDNTLRIVDIIDEDKYFSVMSKLSGQQKQNLKLLNELFFTKHESFWYEEGALVSVVNFGKRGTWSAKNNYDAIQVFSGLIVSFIFIFIAIIIGFNLNKLHIEMINVIILPILVFVSLMIGIILGNVIIPLIMRFYNCSCKPNLLLEQEFILYKSCLKKFVFVNDFKKDENLRLHDKETIKMLIQENNIKTALENNFDYVW